MISGGFDGNVFVTDISRLVGMFRKKLFRYNFFFTDDIQKSEKKSENSVYLCKDVVGSVSWHPNDHNVASCTTDPVRKSDLFRFTTFLVGSVTRIRYSHGTAKASICIRYGQIRALLSRLRG